MGRRPQADQHLKRPEDREAEREGPRHDELQCRQPRRRQELAHGGAQVHAGRVGAGRAGLETALKRTWTGPGATLHDDVAANDESDTCAWRNELPGVACVRRAPQARGRLAIVSIASHERTNEVAERLRTAFENARPAGVVLVILFGSHAAGRAHRESDVDVGVLLDWSAFPGHRERFDERVRLSSWLAGELRTRDVDVVVLNDAPPLLGRHVATQGIRVFCSDPEAAHAFVRDVQLRAADLLPFLRRMRAIKLAALKR